MQKVTPGNTKALLLVFRYVLIVLLNGLDDFLGVERTISKR